MAARLRLGRAPTRPGCGGSSFCLGPPCFSSRRRRPRGVGMPRKWLPHLPRQRQAGAVPGGWGQRAAAAARPAPACMWAMCRTCRTGCQPEHPAAPLHNLQVPGCMADLQAEPKAYNAKKRICSAHMRADAITWPGCQRLFRFCFQVGVRGEAEPDTVLPRGPSRLALAAAADTPPPALLVLFAVRQVRAARDV